MDISCTQGENLNKIFDDVVFALEDLQLSIKRGMEDDSIPRGKIENALSSMRRLMVDIGSAGEEFAPRKRRVLGLVDDMSDPALQTALGTMQREFSQMLMSVNHVLLSHKDDFKRVNKAELDKLSR